MKALTILLILLCSVASAQVQLDNVQLDNVVATPYEKLFVFDAGSQTIAGFTGVVNGHLTIPQTIGGTAVKVIDYNSFKPNKLIKSVTIPSGITYIGYSAFEQNTFSGQSHITIPSTVFGVGTDVFLFANFTKITIGANVNIEGAFSFGYPLGSSFRTFYDEGGKLAGTYEYIEGSWVKTS